MPGEMNVQIANPCWWPDAPHRSSSPGIFVLVGNFSLMQLAAHAEIAQHQVGPLSGLARLEQEVVGLDIRMDDAAGVQVRQGPSHLCPNVCQL